MMRRLGNRRRGQAIVETALVTPLLVLLVLGAYDTSILASNKVQAISAARHGARVAAQLGGQPNNPAPPAPHTCDGTLKSPPAAGAPTQTSIDQQIVATVAAATSNMTYVTIQHIDIYAPTAADGRYTAGDPIDQYNPDGTVFTGPPGSPQSFLLTKRCQGPLGSSPKDVSIGVRILWTYKATNGLGFGGGTVTFPNISDYAVEKMTTCTDTCL